MMPCSNKSTVHVVHFTSKPGGIEILIPALIRNMTDYVFSVFVIRPPVLGAANVYENAAHAVHYGSAKNFRAFVNLFFYARKNRKDIFHVFNIGPFFLLVLRLAGVRKVLYSIRGSIYWKNLRQKYVRGIAWKLSLSPGYKLIANSNFSKDTFAKRIGYDGSCIEVVYNPIDSGQFKGNGKTRNGKEPLRVIYVGRLVIGKNLQRWLDVAAAIKRHFTDAEFILYGDGPLKSDLQSRSRQLGLENGVHFMGYAPEIAAAYRQADVLLFISEYESFGNVLVESIYSGTPVIAGAIPAMREIFKDFPEFLVEMDENLGKNVLQKLKDLEKLNRLALSAREQFIERFGDELHYKKLRAIYASI